MTQLLGRIIPEANRNLASWERVAHQELEVPLRHQAVSSLTRKRFHAQGAASYALLTPAHWRRLVSLTVALQTLSDYLDNLCDRMGIVDEKIFRRLHGAMAFWHPLPDDIYQGLTAAKDRGYLAGLTRQCHQLSQTLPGWDKAQPHVADLLALYADLQVYKHLHPDQREVRLKEWHRPYAQRYPDLLWNEFAAACGSTLAVFALLAAASGEFGPGRVRQIHTSYFPTICAVHILLDYLIDQEEDKQQGELNFTSLYPCHAHCRERMCYLLKRALALAVRLPESHFHLLVVKGLVAVYLSDPKARNLPATLAEQLLTVAGSDARMLHRLAAFLRQLGIVQRH